MLKNILIVVALLIVFNAVFVFSGGLDLLIKTEQQDEQKAVKVDADIVDVFRFTLEDGVKKKQGTPIEGYEPQMFLSVFPGLVETDFEGVSARIGFYNISDGRLNHDISKAKGPIHSAAASLNRDGYETLLNNVAKRAGINLATDGTITDVIDVITAQ